MIDVIYLRISDGEHIIPAIYSQECNDEYKTKYEYQPINELKGTNIMVNKYEYILHEPLEEHHDNYKGMCLQIVIHSMKPLPNDKPISPAGINVLHDKNIKAGLKRYKYKRMQAILMGTEKEAGAFDNLDNSFSAIMHNENENSQFSSLSSQLPSLAAVFNKMELSDQYDQDQNMKLSCSSISNRGIFKNENSNFVLGHSQMQNTMLSSVYNLNTHSYIGDKHVSTSCQTDFESHKPNFTFKRLVPAQKVSEVQEFLRLSQRYVQEMSEEDKKLRQIMIKIEVDHERTKAMKQASRDPVVQRINKVVNKPSESNVHQRGAFDLEKPKILAEGIKEIIIFERQKRILRGEIVEIEPKQEAPSVKVPEDIERNSKFQTGSVFGISTFKSYIEWYHLKKYNIDDASICQSLNTKMNPSALYNPKSHGCASFKK